MTEVRASGQGRPASRLRWSGAFAVALVVLFLVSSYVPGVAGVGSAAAPPLASLHPSPEAPSGRYGGASPSMHVRPSFTCPTTTEEYQWVQGSDYTLAPPLPERREACQSVGQFWDTSVARRRISAHTALC